MKKKIEIKNLYYTFKKDTPLLFDDQHYTITQNELTLITGKNGAGKSTFFHILAADPLLKENVSGTLTIDGKTYTLNSNEYSDFARKKITLVGQ